MKARAAFVPERSGAGAFGAAFVQNHGAVRNDDAEGGAERAFQEPDLAAMRAHELGRDHEAEARAAAACRALKRLEQVRAGAFGQAGPCIGHLQHDDRALAAADDADLVAFGIVRRTRQ